MNSNHIAHRLHQIVFKLRFAFIALSLVILVYCNVYLWLYIPYLPYSFGWQTDHTMRIIALPEDLDTTSSLELGDAIIAINGRPVRRTLIFFPPESQQSQYTITLIRDKQTITVRMPFLNQPDTTAIETRLISGILSFITWVIGTVILRYAWLENSQAIWLGLIFLLASVVVLGLNAMLMGVPYAHLFSQPFIVLLSLGWIYMGLLPRYTPFTPTTRRVLSVLLLGALGYGAASLLEASVLLAKGESVEALTGVSLYRVGVFSLGVGGIVLFSLLFVRRLRAQARYLRNQLNLLLFFTTFSFLPAMVFAFIPLSIWGKPILPIPLALIGLVIAPLGYFYVIFRHAYLTLDKTFSRLITYSALILIFITIYSLSLYALSQWFNPIITTFQLSILLVLVAAIILPLVAKSIYGWMYRALFGSVSAINEHMKVLAENLVHQPDIETFKSVVAKIANLVNIPHATVALYNGEQEHLIQIGQGLWSSRLSSQPLPIQPLLRTADGRSKNDHPIFAEFPLAYIVLPLRARDQIIGTWVLSKPRDGYLQQDTLTFLEHAATTLSIGGELMFLLDAAELLSRQIITVQEEEQRHFATLLHDEPLQKLYAIRSSIAQKLKTSTNNQCLTDTLQPLADSLSTLEEQLRDVYEASSPKLLEYDISTVINILADSFQLKTGIAVKRELQLSNTLHQSQFPSLRRVIYHVVRESFNNILKHSDATHVNISVHHQFETLHLAILDNGTTNSASYLTETELLRQRHFGIIGMKAWAKSVGGSLQIVPQAAGTKIQLKIPLSNINSFDPPSISR